MYTDTQIRKMTPKVHPAIKMATTWGAYLSDEDYNDKFEEMKKWALTKKSLIADKYGKEAADIFVKIAFPMEIKSFIRAGFDFNYEHINNLIDTCIVNKGFDFLEQELAGKLFPIRESITTIALASNGLWQAKKEFRNDLDAYKEKTVEMVQLTTDTLKLLSQGESGQIQYLSKITEEMEKNSKKLDSAIFIKALKSVKHEVNKNVYAQKTEGYIVSPENNA